MSRRPAELDDPAVIAANRGQFVGSRSHPPSRHEDPGLPPPARGPPSGFELERVLAMSEVCALTGLSRDSIQRHYRHLLLQLSPRRVGMKLRDALSIGAAT
jgi:hypothetical protein